MKKVVLASVVSFLTSIPALFAADIVLMENVGIEARCDSPTDMMITPQKTECSPPLSRTILHLIHPIKRKRTYSSLSGITDREDDSPSVSKGLLENENNLPFLKETVKYMFKEFKGDGFCQISRSNSMQDSRPYSSNLQRKIQKSQGLKSE